MKIRSPVSIKERPSTRDGEHYAKSKKDQAVDEKFEANRSQKSARDAVRRKTGNFKNQRKE